ncbi:MAG TPA: PASTA domain-containing protein, partial [Nocardioides sp.]
RARDDDLVADLLPRPAPDPDAPDRAGDTSPEPFDAADLDDLRGDGFADAELYPALAQASAPTRDEGDTAVRRRPAGAVPPPPRDPGDVTSRLYLGEDPEHGQDGEDDDGSHDDVTEAADQARRRSRRRARLLGSLVIVLALVGGLAFYFLSWRYVPAPRLLDLTQAEATERARDDGFTVEVGPAGYSETVAAGLVMATDPEGGADVVRGGTITLTVSRGPERYAVPSLAGRTAAEAREVLEGTNLEYDEAEPRYDEEVPEGAVIASDPAQGTVVRPDQTVTVVLSLGRRPIPVEDWTGRPRSDAEAALTTGDPEIDGDELQVAVTEEFSDTVAAGTVISQDPTSGTLHLGDTVTLVVSKGPELVTIPDGLVGDRVEEARAQLEGLGLEVEEESLIGSDGPRIGYVTGVSPGGGERVRRGSTVTLTVL